MQKAKEILVVGAGPVGLSAALLLNAKGHKVTVLEKRKDPRIFPENGRSINLALSNRGFNNLYKIGLEEKIKKDLAVPMYGRMVHEVTGSVHFQPYSADGNCIYSVSRGELNHLLLDNAEEKGLPINFEMKLLDYDIDHDQLHFENSTISTKEKIILACDGAYSSIRKAFQNIPGFQHKETTLDYAYQEYSIPTSKDGNWQLDNTALHIWPRKDFMMIALPNKNGSFTCTLFLKLKGDNSFEEIQNPENAKQFFKTHFADALPLMDNFLDEQRLNPVSTLFMETCFPWSLDDKVLLLGDAAHAIVPFYGQGLNAGLEDVSLLIEETDKADWKEIFTSYQEKRKKDTDAISDLALQNFIEMRDLVTDDKFLLKKKLESKIKAIYPLEWKTQYEQVTFSDLPYSKAKSNGIENTRKIDLIMENTILTENLLTGNLTEQDLYLLSSIIL